MNTPTASSATSSQREQTFLLSQVPRSAKVERLLNARPRKSLGFRVFRGRTHRERFLRRFTSTLIRSLEFGR